MASVDQTRWGSSQQSPSPPAGSREGTPKEGRGKEVDKGKG